MTDFIVSKEELIEMFSRNDIKDTDDGWLYKEEYYINIIALHQDNPKYIYDVSIAQSYKITAIKSV